MVVPPVGHMGATRSVLANAPIAGKRGVASTPLYEPPPEVAALLADPERWCEGASRLSEAHDPRGIEALMIAYDGRGEASRICLLDAIDALGGQEYAGTLYDSGEPMRRKMGLRLMELLPGESHLSRLVDACNLADADLRTIALRSYRTQRRTSGWEVAGLEILRSPHADARRAAVEGLTGRSSQVVREGLEAHLTQETDTIVRSAIEVVLGR